jgi:hypothetical protein
MDLSQANQRVWQRTQREIAPGSSVSELVRQLEIRTEVELSKADDR